MIRPTLTPEQYLVELNRRLKLHEAYVDGMEFIPFPLGAVGRDLSGYSVTGPFGLMGIYALISHQVTADFDLLV